MIGKTTNLILLGILTGVILGGLLGFYASDFMLAISIIGTLFLNALTLLALPLIITALVVGVTALGDYRKLARVGGKTIWYFSLIGLIAVIIGIAVTQINFGGVLSFDPLASRELAVDSPYLNYSKLMNEGSLFFGLLNYGQYLAFIFLVVFFGGALTGLGVRNSKNIRDLFRDVHEGLLKLFSFMLYLAPVGIFSLVGTAVALQAPRLDNLFAQLGWYLLLVTGAFLVMGIIILPLFLKLSGHQSPGRYFYGMLPALLTALGTGSSTAALPVSYEGVVSRNNIDQRAAGLVLPLGTIFNIGATAMWLVMTIIFLSQGVEGAGLTILQIIVVAVLSLLVSIGLAGAPLVAPALAVMIAAAGLPSYMLAGMVVFAVVPLFTDRLRACLNVWGDAVGAAVISESLEFKAVGRVKKTIPRETRPRGPRRGRPDTGGDRRKTDSRQRSKGDPRRRDGHGSVPRTENRPDIPPRRDVPTGQFQKSEKRSPFEMKASTMPDFDKEPEVDKPKKEVTGYKPEYRKPTPPPSRDRVPEAKSFERRMPPPPAEQGSGTLKKDKKEARVDLLDNEVFKKELARVSAHLQDIDKKHVEMASEKQAVSETGDEITSTSQPEETERESGGITPNIDFLKSVKREASEEASAAEVETSDTTPAEEEAPAAEEPIALEYGRSRYRRPDKSRSDDFPAPQPVSEEKAPKAEDSFSNENISFGRTKKKKTR
ncbi:MAG: dicarboxylate/amino acid:cation symporter [candidate division Zixibacteria bacterium]|nr:dicarboxylate/amino acid:cation symporter [candidate division Zixibacteria bacterium]